MKIGIIGATGKAGSLIVKEAIGRGHEVTAIVRDLAKLSDEIESPQHINERFTLVSEAE